MEIEDIKFVWCDVDGRSNTDEEATREDSERAAEFNALSDKVTRKTKKMINSTVLESIGPETWIKQRHSRKLRAVEEDFRRACGVFRLQWLVQKYLNWVRNGRNKTYRPRTSWKNWFTTKRLRRRKSVASKIRVTTVAVYGWTGIINYIRNVICLFIYKSFKVAIAKHRFHTFR